MLKFALIGAGNQGKFHARFIDEHPGAQLVAVCDMMPGKAAALAAPFGARAFNDVAQMLASEEIDAVDVVTAGVENGSHHFEPVMQCLEAGKPVLCEKPISNNIEQARRMVAKAREKGVPFGVDLNHRFTPAADKLKRLQNDGALGDVLIVNMALWLNNPNEPSPWHHLRALHPHSIDVMRYFGGPIEKVHAFMLKAPGRQTMWSTFQLNVQFTSGAVGHLTGSTDASWQHPIERCEVMGTGGRGVIENVYQRLEWMPRGEKEKLVLENSIMGGLSGFNDTIKRRLARFIEQVESAEDLDASGEDGLAAQEIIEAAIASRESGSVIHLNGRG
jgi:UDP-N-acetylglucosamine 3-dehydrogenase